MEPKTLSSSKLHLLLLNSLSKHQRELIKGPVVNMDNQFNEVFPSFDPLNPKFALGCRIIDIFPSHFSFNLFSKCNDDTLKSQIHQLDNITIKSSNNTSHTPVITDASVKNNIATSISHIHIRDKPTTETLHHTVNIMSTEAELFAIRCGINQAINSTGISKIIIIMNSIHTAKKIFNTSLHPFQIHAAAILKELCLFFSCSQENSIEFWKCLSRCNWSLHKVINKETKLFNPVPLFSCKSSWDFSKKNECNDLTNRWKMIFQALNTKEKHFLDLLDSDDNFIELSYIKDSSWLKYFGHSNSLCVRASKAITNYTPIGEYRLRFFLREDFSCPCSSYLIKTRKHILYECRRFNKYWNLRQDSISYFILFLKFNPSVFAFASPTI